MTDNVCKKTDLVKFFRKCVGDNAFWFPVCRSTRTFTPVTCPWAT